MTTPDRLRMKIKEMGVKAGVPKLHSHSFRHFIATTLLNEGRDISGVQQQLGHLDVSSA